MKLRMLPVVLVLPTLVLAPMPSVAVESLPAGTLVITPPPGYEGQLTVEEINGADGVAFGIKTLDGPHFLTTRKEAEAILLRGAELLSCKTALEDCMKVAAPRRGDVEWKTGWIVGGFAVGLSAAFLAGAWSATHAVQLP